MNAETQPPTTEQIIDAVEHATFTLNAHMRLHQCHLSGQPCETQQRLRDEQLAHIAEMCERYVILDKRILRGL
jgi:hypothetical protein